MKAKFFIFALSWLIITGHLLAYENSEPTPVASVDLKRYMGLWHEIARLPNAFEANCIQSTSQYTLTENGDVHFLNSCLKANGREKQAKAMGQVSNAPSNSKLKINFAPKWLQWTGFGSTEHWIIDLGKNYEYAVVSEPGKRYLWILSRSPVLEKQTYDSIISKLKGLHFDLSHLVVNERQISKLKAACSKSMPFPLKA